ncbi:rhomboid family intramembrane serine protease [Telmatocola sphagniphila]|uniref:Rhomboid family intramembrane serine protease n=1 Tax=Telmatocola sphagniphila TaxID=1123043 RepID=A0A8E6F0K1_9BACT|nr:rhomboid family intramembrane serine protease [Telmatocola sphagniphila]QVL34631.1 rhomboid family intramembrane serine protease [Telmatocola sphagniphila]
MTESESKALTCESLLREIAASNPPPWYPRVFVSQHSVDRQKLDELLTELRLSGIIQLTEWQKEFGQGYRITAYGNEVLGNPVMMERLKGPFEAQSIKLKTTEPPTKKDALQTSAFERGEIVREALLMPKKAIVTNILISLNLLIFALCLAQCFRWEISPVKFLFSGDFEVIRRMGGLTAMEIARDHWTGLFTYAFLHFGILHLGVNMYSLYLLGRFLETAWGSGRFLIIYMLSILGGSTASLIFEPGTPAVPTLLAGASGAIWGLSISYIVWLVWNRTFIPPNIYRESVQNFMIAMVLNLGISYLPHISLACHLGGGVMGGIAATLLYLHWHYSPSWKSFAFAMLSLLPVFCISFILNQMKNSPDWIAIMDVAKLLN